MTDVAVVIAVLIFGLGVFALGLWAAWGLRPAKNHKQSEEGTSSSRAASRGYKTSV